MVFPLSKKPEAETFYTNDQKLAFIYFEDEPQRRMTMKRMSKDDAWQLARAITRIPALLQRD
jgi:hypothetical protein